MTGFCHLRVRCGAAENLKWFMSSGKKWFSVTHQSSKKFSTPCSLHILIHPSPSCQSFLKCTFLLSCYESEAILWKKRHDTCWRIKIPMPCMCVLLWLLTQAMLRKLPEEPCVNCNVLAKFNHVCYDVFILD